MTASARARVWDLPTRLCHWGIALLIPLLWWSAEEGRLDIHIPAGLTMLGLVLFRLLWGLAGGSTARFAGFVRGPRAILAYLKGEVPGSPGHNPLGAVSVVVMLAALVVQVGLGLFASDEDGLSPGPLAHFVSYDTSERITDLHESLFNLLLALIALHLAAILFYLIVRRRNLTGPMITGRGAADPAEPALRPAPAWRFWTAAAASALVAGWLGGLV